MMRLSEIVSTLTPAAFTIVAMLIVLVVFIAIVIRTYRPSERAEHARAIDLPFDDGAQS